jgi:hypothetical protein
MLQAYAESEGKNGLIVALDQEKAYDKVIHDYLWEVLKRFGLPTHFIKTVALLYQNAESVIIINGVISTPFHIHREVRQGDPLSCLLFDYAIEPLTLMLKNSPLKGYKIPHLTKRLLASLFADDTTVYSTSERMTTSQTYKMSCTHGAKCLEQNSI